MDETDFSRLKNLRLFAGFSLQELETIARRGTVRNLRRVFGVIPERLVESFP